MVSPAGPLTAPREESPTPHPNARLIAWLGAGFALSFLGWGAFAVVAERVFHAPAILNLDARAQDVAIALRGPTLTKCVIAVTTLGDGQSVAIASILIGLALLYRRSHRRLVAFAATMIGGGVLNVLLKNAFHRQRPIEHPALIKVSDYSFPSGHAMGTMLVCASLAYVAWFSTERASLRALAVTSAIVAVCVIGATRVYLGVHYFSDVLAGFACGFAWAALCVTATEAWIHGRDQLRAVLATRRARRRTL